MIDKKIFIVLGFILFLITLVFGLFIIPTYLERQELREKLISDIKKDFKDSFPEIIWKTVRNAENISFGNAYYGEDNKLTLSEEKFQLTSEALPKIKDIITDPYSYEKFNDWFIEENAYINKHYVIYPVSDPFFRVYSYGIDLSIFIPNKYIEFRTRDSIIKLFLDEDSSALSYISSDDRWIYYFLEKGARGELISILEASPKRGE